MTNDNLLHNQLETEVYDKVKNVALFPSDIERINVALRIARERHFTGACQAQAERNSTTETYHTREFEEIDFLLERLEA